MSALTLTLGALSAGSMSFFAASPLVLPRVLSKVATHRTSWGAARIRDRAHDVYEVDTNSSLSIVAGIYRPTHVPATSSYLGSVFGAAVSLSGDLYVDDSLNYVVDRVTRSGRLSVVAGVFGKRGPPTAGPATSSELGSSSGVALDSAGDLFIADGGNEVVEEVTPAGRLSIVAGIAGDSGRPTPGPADSSKLGKFISGIAVDSAGDLFIADQGNEVVEEVTPAGRLSIIAGIVNQTGPPTPGPADRSTFGNITGVTVDSAGDLFIADAGNGVVEEVTSAGRLSVVAGIVNQDGRPTPGPADRSRLGFPVGVAVNSTDDLFIADAGNDVIEEITTSGSLSVFAGSVGKSGVPTPGAARDSLLGELTGVAIGIDGAIYIEDSSPNYNSVVEMVTSRGRLSVVAGVVSTAGLPSAGVANRSKLNHPNAVAVDARGDLFIADLGNDVVEKVTPEGELSIIAGIAGNYGRPTPGSAIRSELDEPSGVAVDARGAVFIADAGNDVVEEVSPSGQLSIAAGIIGKGGTPTAGPADESKLGIDIRSGLAVDAEGDLYIADSSNATVEERTPAGRLSVVAGIVGKPGDPTPGPSDGSHLGAPSGLDVDIHGNLYIADLYGYVEKVSPAGRLSIVATPPTRRIEGLSFTPFGVAVDQKGNVYVSDRWNGVVEEIGSTKRPLVIVGVVGALGPPTVGSPLRSELGSLCGLAIGASGQLFIADYFNNVVEEVKE